MRIAVYCRVSTDKFDQQNSLQNQQVFFRQYVEANKEWELYKIYSDEKTSGTQTKNRKQFNQMIEDAKNGHIDLILTKEISRFSRNTVDVLHYTRLLKNYNTYVYFINDGINTAQNDGELRLAIMASIAQEESRKISQRVCFGQKQSMKNGMVFGNGNLYGYMLKKGKLEVEKDKVEAIRSIFCMYTIFGYSILEIYKILQENGVEISKSSISNIIKNEKYVGDLCQRKSITTDYITHSRKINNTDFIYIKDHHVPIITRKLWDLTILEHEKRLKNPQKTKKHWLSSKLQCGYCNKNFTLKKVGDYIYFRKNCNACKVSNLTMISIETAVNQAIKFENKVSLKIKKEILSNVLQMPYVKLENIENYIKQLDFLGLDEMKSRIIKNVFVFQDYINIEFNFNIKSCKIYYKVSKNSLIDTMKIE